MTITSEFRDRFRFNDGEGLNTADFNGMLTLGRRHLFTDVLGALGQTPWYTASGAAAVRTIGNALRPVHVPATATVRITAGAFLYAPAADPGTPSQWALFHRLGTNASSTSDVGTSSANALVGVRNDLLTVKVEDSQTNASDNETRDFEDASSRAVTTQATSKRYRTKATFRVIEGTVAGVDPAVPAGEVAIARYVMQNATSTYAAADITDLRTGYDPAAGTRIVQTDQIPLITGLFVNCAYDEPNGYLLASGAPWSAAIPLRVFNGQRIRSLQIARYGTGAGSIALSLRRVTTAGVRTVVQTVTDTNPAAAYADTTLTLTAEEVVGSAVYYGFISGSTATQRAVDLRWTWTNLP